MRIIVVGGGAAGLTAAAFAAKAGAQVTVLEKNERPARKVMITGKGRCNVTNRCSVPELIAHVTGNGKFLYSAFTEFSSEDTIRYFEELGVALKTERGNRVFPVSDRAVDIVDAMVRSARSAGVKIRHAEVAQVLAQNGKITGVRLSDNTVLAADRVLIATGGVSYPTTGSTGDGFRFAAELGHTVEPLRPSLVPLCIREHFCEQMMGLSLKNVRLELLEQGRKKPLFSGLGEMLFTHFGVSGPLVLSASAYLRSPGEKSYLLRLNLKPALSPEQLDDRLCRDFSAVSNRDFGNSLGALLPQKMIPVMVRLSGIDREQKVHQISREQRRRLCEILQGLPMHIDGTRPMEEAIVTAGGVCLKEVSSKTMESRLVRGLYFAGEVLDLDACTGGFNLQIAFSTAVAAARGMTRPDSEQG